MRKARISRSLLRPLHQSTSVFRHANLRYHPILDLKYGKNPRAMHPTLIEKAHQTFSWDLPTQIERYAVLKLQNT